MALGDLIWPLCAILGLAWVLAVWGELLDLLRWVAAAVFVVMGWLLIRAPARPPGADSRLTRPGVRAGFPVGAAAPVVPAGGAADEPRLGAYADRRGVAIPFT